MASEYRALGAVIGDRLLVDIRQHVLVDAANALYPNCKPSSRNSLAFAPAAAVLHHAAENDLCPYVRIKKLKERSPEPRAMRKEDAARLIAAADGKLKLLLVFLFSQGWRISDNTPAAMGGHRFNRGDGLVSHFQDRRCDADAAQSLFA